MQRFGFRHADGLFLIYCYTIMTSNALWFRISNRGLIVRRRSSSHKSLELNAVSNLPNHRFWTQSYRMDVKNETNVAQFFNNSLSGDVRIDLSKVQMGIVFSATTKQIIPIHNGKLQVQHTTNAPEYMYQSGAESNDDKLTVKNGVQQPFEGKFDDIFLCAFSPRATHVVIPPNEEERPIDMDRLSALDVALEVTISQVLT